MTGNSPNTAAYGAEGEFVEGLRYALYTLENEPNGTRKAAITACHAVARFIYLKSGRTDLAAPFLAIKAGLEDLEKGIVPELFALDPTPKKKSQSAQRRHARMMAVAALDVLVQLGSPLTEAARHVASYVSKWTEFKVANVKTITVINWRKQLELNPREKRQFDEVRRSILEDCANAEDEVNRLLREGPPGMPKS